MKVLTKITDTISKVAEWIIMAMILGLVGLIVTELCRRNFLNQSWLPTTELCGILFLWMAFIGIIPLYNKSGLIRLDFLVTRLHGIAAEIVWYITDLVGLGLGVVMIMASMHSTALWPPAPMPPCPMFTILSNTSLWRLPVCSLR